jgi:general secretion pathway protein A
MPESWDRLATIPRRTGMLVMYEAFFGLHRRPFGATPDVSCFLSLPAIQGILDELVVCVEQGLGVAVVTAPAGAGKTLLCQKLLSELGPQLVPVFVHHGNFDSRKALLQTILCTLNKPYQRPSNQELRLELAPVLKGLARQGRSLVIVCDEAHVLSESLLEELRILTDQSENGAPLARLVLCGQPELDETLAAPSMRALNQRIRAHVHLDLLTRAESREYIDHRITWGGGRTDELVSAEALELMVEAADGSPRCLNQLCDHTLLLAYVLEQKPVPVETVREALEDLQQLPLQWNVPRRHRDAFTAADRDDWESPGEFASTESGADGMTAVEFGAGMDDESPVSPSRSEVSETGEVEAAWETSSTGQEPQPAAVEEEYGEERVVDRYAALDAGLDPEELFPAPVELDDTADSEEVRSEIHEPGDAIAELDSLLQDETERAALESPGDSSLERQLGSEVLGLYRDVQRTFGQQSVRLDRGAAVEDDYEDEDAAHLTPEFFSIETDEPVTASGRALPGDEEVERPYRNLFSRLRRKQFEEQ